MWGFGFTLWQSKHSLWAGKKHFTLQMGLRRVIRFLQGGLGISRWLEVSTLFILMLSDSTQSISKHSVISEKWSCSNRRWTVTMLDKTDPKCFHCLRRLCCDKEETQNVLAFISDMYLSFAVSVLTPQFCSKDSVDNYLSFNRLPVSTEALVSPWQNSSSAQCSNLC